MVTIKMFYDRPNSNYRCTLIDNFIYKCLSIDKVKELVKSIHFNRIKIEDNTIYLRNSDTELIIEDVDKCNILMDILATNYKLVEKALQKEKNSPITSIFPLNIIKNKRIIKAVLVSSVLGTFALGKLFNHSEPIIDVEPIIAYEIKNDIPEVINSPKTNTEMIITKEFDLEEKKEIEEHADTIYFDHGSKVDTLTYKIAYERNYNMVLKSSKKWGLDPDHVMAVLAQESGGVLTNLMQFNFNSFKGGKMTSYNFDENRYVTYFFTDDPEYVTCSKYIVVRSTDLNDPQINIDMGALFIRYNIDCYDNVMAGTLCYNQGSGNMEKIFKAMTLETGKSKDDVLSDYTDLSFNDYTYVTHVGDKNYLDNVFGFYPKDSINYYVNNDGIIENKTVEIKNKEYVKALNY